MKTEKVYQTQYKTLNNGIERRNYPGYSKKDVRKRLGKELEEQGIHVDRWIRIERVKVKWSKMSYPVRTY